MIRARKSQISFYLNIALYTRSDDRQFVLYKPRGKTLGDMRVSEDRLPEKLYIRKEDRIQGIQEAQKGFNRQLADNIKSGNPDNIKETLLNVVEETLTEPRSGSLEGFSDTIDILISDYAQESDIVRQLFDVSCKDYSTVLHSINVMAFALAFASYVDLPPDKAKVLGMSALLHDVGKTKIDQEILAAPRKLSDEEFEEMKRHTFVGYTILRGCSFRDKNISLAALEHHEKLDGTGYPSHKRKISEVSQIVGIIDCYEALTNNDRPYRNAMIPIETLSLLRGDVKAGKFDRSVFEQFAYCLVGK